jgi:hypothetical protein
MERKDERILINQKFGMLRVSDVWRDVAGRTTVVCKCDCGGKWYGNFNSKVCLPMSCGCRDKK